MDAWFHWIASSHDLLKETAAQLQDLSLVVIPGFDSGRKK